MEEEIKKEIQPEINKENMAKIAATSAKEKNAMAIVAYVVFFIPLLTEAKNDPFVKYHVKQGLVLFVAWVATGFVSAVPVIGWMLAPLLSLAMLALMVIGIINVSQGKQKPLPLIGKYADSFKI